MNSAAVPLALDVTTLEKLPSLATDCLLIGHARKADVVWSRSEFLALCEHMLNENDPTCFMIPYRRQVDGRAAFAKAKRPRVAKHAEWAWDTIIGRAKTQASIGFYPRTPNETSRWAALDFDAHDGNSDRARDWALNAFRLLMKHPELFVILCTSGSDGWHLFVFSRGFHAVGDWIRLLKQTAAFVGAEVAPGLCEIFPSETRGRIGYGIRAPGTWNPKNGEIGKIAYQSVSSLLSLTEREKGLFIYRLTAKGDTAQFTNGEKRGVYRGPRDEWKWNFRIDAPSSRHLKLLELVDAAFYLAGRELALANAELQHGEATLKPTGTLAEHIEEFSEYWQWRVDAWVSELTPDECEKFKLLETDRDRDAFRMIKNFSRFNPTEKDFPVACQALADGLGLTIPGASKLRTRFTLLGLIVQTKPYVPNKSPARFRWTANPSPQAL